MDKATFADTEAESKWWLLEAEIHHTMVEVRMDLSEVLGYARDNEWYVEKWKVELLYDLLEDHDRNLLTELDQANDDDKRKQWLDSVLAALRPKDDQATPPPGSKSPAADLPAAAPPAPAKKSGGIFAKKDAQPAAAETPVMDASEAVKVVMSGLDDKRIADLAAELQMTADEVRTLLAELPDGFEQEVAKEAQSIAAQAS